MAVFSKVLTKIDVERRLSLTADDEEGVPPFLGEQPMLLRVKDENGGVWSFRRCTVLVRSGIRPKLLIDDSRQFVRSRGLSTGDEINLFWEFSHFINHKPKKKLMCCFPIRVGASGGPVYQPVYQYKIEVIRKNRVPSH